MANFFITIIIVIIHVHVHEQYPKCEMYIQTSRHTII